MTACQHCTNDAVITSSGNHFTALCHVHHRDYLMSLHERPGYHDPVEPYFMVEKSFRDSQRGQWQPPKFWVTLLPQMFGGAQ